MLVHVHQNKTLLVLAIISNHLQTLSKRVEQVYTVLYGVMGKNFQSILNLYHFFSLLTIKGSNYALTKFYSMGS